MAVAKRGAERITSRELARRLGRDARTLRKWIAEGAPVLKHGRGGEPSEFDEADFRAWLDVRERDRATRTSDLMVSRSRKELAQALEAEQRVAIRAKTLVHVEEVERAWSAHVAGVRARLLSIPTALPDRLVRAATIDGAAGVEKILQETMYQVLTELAARKARRPSKKIRPARTTRTARARS
jgi:phage terminase Nu1 subunit (DNA packaging protein)